MLHAGAAGYDGALQIGQRLVKSGVLLHIGGDIGAGQQIDEGDWGGDGVKEDRAGIHTGKGRVSALDAGGGQAVREAEDPDSPGGTQMLGQCEEQAGIGGVGEQNKQVLLSHLGQVVERGGDLQSAHIPDIQTQPAEALHKDIRHRGGVVRGENIDTSGGVEQGKDLIDILVTDMLIGLLEGVELGVNDRGGDGVGHILRKGGDFQAGAGKHPLGDVALQLGTHVREAVAANAPGEAEDGGLCGVGLLGQLLQGEEAAGVRMLEQVVSNPPLSLA